MGSVAGSLEALALLRSLGASTIVPGHGALCGPEQIEVVETYLLWLQGIALEAHAAGLSPLEAARAIDLGEYAEWLDPERIVGNLHRAYMEIPGGGGEPGGAGEAAVLGAPADVPLAFGEMIAYNGGRPLTCYA
jgi:cyclase